MRKQPVAFVGSRSLPVGYQPLVLRVVASFSGHPIITTCGWGTTAVVRRAVPTARVFSIGQYRGNYVARLVQRGVAMVRFLASQQPALIVGFVTVPCPAKLRPTTSSSKAWSGHGSGSWAELAFAAGHGVAVDIYWCAPGPPQLPASWGQWLIPSGVGAAGQPCILLPSGMQAAFGPAA